MKKITLSLAIVLISCISIFAQTWTQQTSPVPTPLGINSAWAVDYNICWMSGAAGVCIRTTNGGTTWTRVDAGLAGTDCYTICALDANTAWIGAGDGGLWRTTNAGTTWTFFPLTPASPFIDVVHFFNANTGFVLGDPFASMWCYYTTTNGGTNWTSSPNRPPSVGTEAGWNNSYEALDVDHIWWGTNVNKIYKGPLNGPFTFGPTVSASSFGIAFKDLTTGLAIMANAAGSAVLPVEKSINGGTSWSGTGYTPTISFGLKSRGGWFWYSSQTVVSRSTNDGTSWVSQLTLPTNNAGYALTMYSVNRGWVGTQGSSALACKIYRYDDVVGINNNQNQTPTKFTMSQNYPNPFNPTTYIDFNLANTGYVTLKVYDMMGREVITLVDGVYSEGVHNVIFNANQFSSGTYFYTMTSGDFKETRTMMLIK